MAKGGMGELSYMTWPIKDGRRIFQDCHKDGTAMSYEYWKPEVRYLFSLSLQSVSFKGPVRLLRPRELVLALLPEQ